MKTLRLGVGGFARRAVELHGEAELAEVLAEALRLYGESCRHAGVSPDLPGFISAGPPSGPTFVDVPVEDELAETLTSDRELQAISADLQATHALFVYLAEGERRSAGPRTESGSIAS